MSLTGMTEERQEGGGEERGLASVCEVAFIFRISSAFKGWCASQDSWYQQQNPPKLPSVKREFIKNIR